MGISSMAVTCQVPFAIAREAFAQWPSLWGPLVHLHGVSVGSSALVSLLSGGARTIGRVHGYHHIIHPWWGIGRGYLSRRESLCGLGIPQLEALLGLVIAEPLEVRCVLCDQVDQLHRFDDGDESFLHSTIGGWYWGCEYFVQ